METESLVIKAKKGDKEALVKLIMLKEQEYYKLAYIYMKNKEDSLDAMEDMIILLYDKIHQLKKEEAFYSWSKTILVNCCKKQLKNQKKFVSIDQIKEAFTEGEIEQKEDQLLLDKYLSQLKEQHQEVLKLRYFLDLEYETIASILKIPLGTVKSRLSIGLKKLKESMGGEGYEKG
ncbi:RNA polymerase sigma factor [Alkaliphilus transvaalensis]|uniref:RNA polymerase sigma factor n=1 Tax=Alkaliphilus transvaalensis TaxID=114628 RepID=UPI0004793ACD|nr:sigma-70 family RNA polymerase sigma factor [Alkaliphilus transvaalensis]